MDEANARLMHLDAENRTMKVALEICALFLTEQQRTAAVISVRALTQDVATTVMQTTSQDTDQTKARREMAEAAALRAAATVAQALAAPSTPKAP